MNKLDSLDIDELICAMAGMTEDETNQAHEDCSFENILWEKYKVELDSFIKIANDLIKLTPQTESAITKQRYHSFVKTWGSGYVAIAKVTVDEVK